MKQKNKTRLARAAMTLLLALLTTFGAWAETVTFDFEDGVIPSNWTNDATYPWTVVSESQGSGHHGVYCIKSGNSGVNSSSSSIEATFTFVGDGSISFFGGCWGEGTSTAWDKCIFYIDGVQQFAYGALQTWDTYRFEVEAGEHKFKWSFTKDSSVNATGDAFFIDDIVIDLGSASACSKPTALSVELTPGNGTVASLSWTENGSATAWQICLNDDETNLIDATSNPYTLENLTPEQTYTAKVRACCDAENQSSWSSVVTFKPTNAYSITVNDGTTTNEYVPFYGYYADSDTKGQFIIPASTLQDIAYGTINKLTFYVNNSTSNTTFTNSSGTSSEFEVYMGEVDNTTFDGTTFNDWTSLEKVMNAATLEVKDHMLVVTLDAPYQYMGGNLLIGFNETTNGGYAHTYWYGVSATGASLGGNGTSFSQKNFLPKTTFDYTPGVAPTCLKPTNLVAGTPDAHSVELSWTENGEATQWQICVNDDETNLLLVDENPYTLTGLTGDTDYSVKVRAYCSADDQSRWSNEVTFTTLESCAKPTNLAENNITYTTADLSWEGTNDSYVVQYGTWTQVGTDQIATAYLTPYTFDLSGFSGKGTVAIRHYNVTDMFYLNVDDIEVKNANGETVFSDDFENGSIPSNMSNIDLDGDGYAWDLANSVNMTVNGSYGLYSASWYSGLVLNPDNWLVISDIQLGGSITFKAVGQDPSVPYENFGVYVIADNQLTEAYNGTNTSCQLTDLTEGTSYVWRVKGVCGEESSNWVSSMFKTKDDLLVFATDGEWDDLDNWTDADDNAATALPTANNKVRIDANATIGDGVVATAKSAVLNGGSITIEEGGQLKQGTTVKVTMHKGITGYGAGNEADVDHYYFIATPHSCSYLEENNLFPYVLNLYTGDNDLYAFDVTADLEWINFESNPSHSEFHQGDNTGLFNKKGYLYANAEDKDLTFVGTVSSSLNNTLTESYTYDTNSTAPFNGWKLIGNPFACNGYVTYSEDATFYKMNAAGNGFEAYENGVVLAPGEGAFMKVSASGTITYSSEAPEGFTSTSTTAAGILPILPLHGEETDQDADLSAAITFAKEGYATYYNGEYDVVLPAGMKAHVVTDGSTNLTYAEVADGDTDGNVVPARTAVLLQVEPSTEAQTLPVYLATPSVASYTGTNLLFGSDEDATTTTGGEKYYKLTYSNNNDKFGWYWGAANGAAFTSPAHKAWLALPASSAPFLGLPGWEETTGIVPVGFDSENGEWYTLQGMKVGKKPSTAGVYIHNGRKVLIP